MSKRSSEDRSLSCASTFSDGRQRRMLRHSKHAPLCLHHDRQLSGLISRLVSAFRFNSFRRLRNRQQNTQLIPVLTPFRINAIFKLR